jgi:hypothetical protein
VDCVVEDEEECDVNSDTIGSENVEDHGMGSGSSDESGIDEAESVDSDGVDDHWQDWWYDHSPLPDWGYAVGSYDHYRMCNISPPRPEFNRLAIIYRIVRHVPLVLIERGA